MAPRKSPAVAAARNPDAVHPQTKPERRKSPNSADVATAAVEKKLTNLKTLNEFLVKQIVELREKEKRATDASLLSAYEREMAFLVLSVRLADEKTRLERQAAMEEKLTVIAVEKVEMKKAFELAMSDGDMKAKEVAMMRAADGEKISSLVEELRAVSLERDRLEVELIDSKKILKSVEEEREMLLDELRRVHVAFDLLKKEKEDAEQSSNLKMKDMSQVIDELERERAEQGVLIASKVEELGCIELARGQLEAELQNHALAKDLLRATFDSMNEELKQGHARALSELKSAIVDFDIIKQEKEQSELRCKTQVKELVGQLDVMERERDEQGAVFSVQVEEIQNLALARDRLKAEVRNSEDAFSRMEELDQGHIRVLGGLWRLHADFVVLKKEKQQSEMSLKLQIEGLVGQLDVIKRERAQQGLVVEKIQNLALGRDRLEEELRSTEDTFLPMMQGNAKELKVENEQSEQRFKLEMKESTKELDALTTELATQKDTIEGERDGHHVEIAGSEIDLQQIEQPNSYGKEELELVKTEHEISGAQKKNRHFLRWFIPAATAILAAGFTTYCAKKRILPHNR